MDFTRGHRSRTRRPVLLLLLLLRLLCIASLHFQRPKEKDFARLDSRREDECSDGFAKARASWAETETIIQSRLPLSGSFGLASRPQPSFALLRLCSIRGSQFMASSGHARRLVDETLEIRAGFRVGTRKSSQLPFDHFPLFSLERSGGREEIIGEVGDEDRRDCIC